MTDNLKSILDLDRENAWPAVVQVITRKVGIIFTVLFTDKL